MDQPLSKETKAFLEDITPEDKGPDPGRKKPRRQRLGRLPRLTGRFVPSMPVSWVKAAHFARANVAVAVLLWRLARLRMVRTGKPPFRVSTGKMAKELGLTKEAVRQTWVKLEKAGLMTVHERRPGRRLLVEINENAGQDNNDGLEEREA
jgi:hypothetical protein